MSAPKKILIGSIALFALIGTLGLVKKSILSKRNNFELSNHSEEGISVVLEERELLLQDEERNERIAELLSPVEDQLAREEVDQIWRLFTTGGKKLPIVETIRYKSRVPWLKGRPAWITDYASHFSTSRHFIARSLNRKRDYETQKISSGDQFNVFSSDKEIQFYLVVDLSRCKMWFYYHDLDADERFLLKTYRVGLGRFDSDSHSGLLTPKGQFLLGEKVSIYKPGMVGYFHEEEVEMVRVFGTRWLPFAEEISGEGDSPRGYGFHGAPWIFDGDAYHEASETIGTYDSDGCIRLSQADIEELYAIVITKPTIVEIVNDYKEAQLPGKEVDR